MTLRIEAGTDVGLRRPHNEDSYGVWSPESAEDTDRGTILVVADGMGGAVAGEIASRIAVDCVLRRHRESCDRDAAECLRRSVEAANRAIHEQSSAYPEMRGMGTTCTALVVRGDAVTIAHVGDSRVYLVRDGEIRQLTEDHSLVAQLVMSRQITPEQARVDPRRNVVTRSVGVWPTVEIDAMDLAEPLRPGDTLVLCTDGLHGVVEDEEIARIASQPEPDRAVRELVDLARERGGPDNITVIIARRGDST